jgi:hypothetical protein
MLTGDLEGARALLDAVLASDDVTDTERARASELGHVLDAWTASGSKPTAKSTADPAPPSDTEQAQDWDRSFASARDLLVTGSFAESARLFNALVSEAPNPTAGARAAELRALARGALPAPVVVQAEAPVLVTNAPAPRQADAVVPRRKAGQWYGWQTLVCDGVSVLTVVVVVGIGGYLLCAPIVHVAHGRGLIALADLGLRVGAPVAGAFAGAGLGYLADDASGRNSTYGGAALVGGVLGFGVGLLGAVIVDAAVLAREDAPLDGREARQSQFTILPVVGPRSLGGLDVGLGGVF